jgi:hypothetical protein
MKSKNTQSVRKTNTTLHMRCLLGDKKRWEHSAQEERLPLTTWVVRVLNRASAGTNNEGGGGRPSRHNTPLVKALLEALNE